MGGRRAEPHPSRHGVAGERLTMAVHPAEQILRRGITGRRRLANPAPRGRRIMGATHRPQGAHPKLALRLQVSGRRGLLPLPRL